MRNPASATGDRFPYADFGTALWVVLAGGFLLEGHRTRTARGTLGDTAQLAHVNPEFLHGAAEGVAVHTQFTGRLALVALVFLEHSKDEALLELTHGFGIENVALVHLKNECFELIFHCPSLPHLKFRIPLMKRYFGGPAGWGATAGCGCRR